MAGRKSQTAYSGTAEDLDSSESIAEDLNALPDDEASQKKLAKWLVADINTAVLASDEAAASKAAQQHLALVIKANGGERTGINASDDAPCARFRRHAAAAPGQHPGWGQCGEFLAVVDGMRVLVNVSTYSGDIAPHVEFNVIDVDRPFLSETGYLSHFIHTPVWGRQLVDVITDAIRGKRRVMVRQPAHIGDLPTWLDAISPPARRGDSAPVSVVETPGRLDGVDDEPDMENPSIDDLVLPTSEITAELTAGSTKALKASARRTDAFVMLPIDRLTIMADFNTRVQTPILQDRVRMYANDMLANGYRIDKPISVFIHRNDDGTESTVVADGHTRIAAAKLANSEGAELEELPVAILPKTTTMDDLLFGLDEANSGTQLTMLEKAINVKRLLNRGVSDAEIMRRKQMTAPALDNLITLAGAPRPVQMMVALNQVAGTHVVNMIRQLGASEATRRLTAQLEKAQAAGKTKVTAGTSPMARYESKVKRAGPALLSAAEAIRTDPGYSALASENRDRLEKLIAELEKLKPAAEPT